MAVSDRGRTGTLVVPVWCGDRSGRLAYRRSVIRIALRVAVVSAALVIAIIVLVVAYVLWQLTPNQLHEQPGPTDIHIYLDTIDLSVAVIGVGGFAIILAGIAAWLIARRAVRPIAEAARMQRTFVADASHELRTPLTVLNARVQRLQRMTPDEDRRRPVVDDLREEDPDPDQHRQRPPRSRRRHRRPRRERRPPGRDGLGAPRHERPRRERGVTLDVEPIDARAGVSETQLRRCLVALTDNAIGHTPQGGHVRITATTSRPG